MPETAPPGSADGGREDRRPRPARSAEVRQERARRVVRGEQIDARLRRSHVSAVLSATGPERANPPARLTSASRDAPCSAITRSASACTCGRVGQVAGVRTSRRVRRRESPWRAPRPRRRSGSRAARGAPGSAKVRATTSPTCPARPTPVISVRRAGHATGTPRDPTPRGRLLAWRSARRRRRRANRRARAVRCRRRRRRGATAPWALVVRSATVVSAPTASAGASDPATRRSSASPVTSRISCLIISRVAPSRWRILMASSWSRWRYP